MALASMNISLPEDLKEYVEAQSQSGYSSPSEFVRELITRDKKRHARRRLEQLLLKGLDSGATVRADEAFWVEAKQEALKRIRTGK